MAMHFRAGLPHQVGRMQEGDAAEKVESTDKDPTLPRDGDEGAGGAGGGPHFERVCSLSELPRGSSRLVRLASGRGILLVRPAGAAATDANPEGVFALDHACYHHGGPLVDGDIEDLGGGCLTIVCPWHAYRIELSRGEGLYHQLDFANLGADGKPTQRLASKGVVQRTHFVRVGGGDVLVADSSAGSAAGGVSAGGAGGAAADDGEPERAAVAIGSDEFAFSDIAAGAKLNASRGVRVRAAADARMPHKRGSGRSKS